MTDVFISYSHRDNKPFEGKKHGWIDLFDKALTQSISDFLGRGITVFRDKKMSGYQGITDTVYGRLAESLILVPVLSPYFLNSEWCPKELEAFSDDNMRRPNGRYQIFPVVKTPVETVPALLTDKLLKHKFFTGEEEDEELVLFRPDLDRDLESMFYSKTIDVARDIARYIKSLPQIVVGEPAQPKIAPETPGSAPIIYLAEPSPDLWTYYEEVRRDLEARGDKFVPSDLVINSAKSDMANEYENIVRNGPTDPDGEAADKEIGMDQCRIVVNLVGNRSTGYPMQSDLSYQQLQMKWAAERNGRADFKHLIWMPTEVKGLNPVQEKFIEEIRGSGVEFFQNSPEEFKSTIQDALKPPPAQHDLPDDEDPPWVYVLYDRSDLKPSLEIENFLQKKKFGVFPTRAYLEDSDSSIIDKHEEWLYKCDAVLIYWNLAPYPWVLSNVFDLQKAKATRDGRKFLASAVFCDGAVAADQKSHFSPPTPNLLKVSGFPELPKFLSKLEVPQQ